MNNNKSLNEEFQKLRVLGKGSYGKVYLMKNKANNSITVVKKFKELILSNKGLGVDQLREIRFLKELDHENIIKPLNIWFVNCRKNSNQFPNCLHLCMEFEYMLKAFDVINDQKISQKEKINIMKQVLEALNYLHKQNILHRDIKPENILIDKQGKVNLCDFGLSRKMALYPTKMTTNIITMNYRPPEIFFGARHYGHAIDIWSAGVTFAEFFLHDFLFEGTSELRVLQSIVNLLGDPNLTNMPLCNNLPNYIQFESRTRIPLRKVIKNCPDQILAILEKMMIYDPIMRPSAESILENEIFQSCKTNLVYEVANSKIQIFMTQVQEQILKMDAKNNVEQQKKK